jgi:yecA family protein
MSISALLNDPEALEKDLQDFASSKEDFEGGMSGLAYGNGLMTAIIVGPEPVPQTEWLPLLLTSADAALDGEDARLLTGMLLIQYGSIIKSLRSRSKPYEPLFWKDGEGCLITSDWARGFLDGMRFREEAWEGLRKDGARAFFALLAVLFQDGGIDAQLLEDGLDPKEFFEDALDRMPDWIQAFYGIREERAAGYRPRTERSAATIPAPAAPARNTRSAA